ncbi:hypothetical protein Clacol_000351 [Clathrus columnatus]|uniref:Uncharacterized protein n=1 Tax=Clathrus columnatus TaxID=1419009 RepID=A0AAV4ZYJ9_9AGAM|nr:hypothetical protein Clacol_000351 [Clathrus columnatus]
MGKQVHASTIKAVFSTLHIPDDARYFLYGKDGSPLLKHPLSALLCNPTRYSHIVKRIIVTEAELPSISLCNTGALGLITVEDEDESEDETVGKRNSRLAVQPIGAPDLTSLLTLCDGLEGFWWRSSNPPMDGLFEVLSKQCPRLSSFIFQPDPPLRAVSFDKKTGISSSIQRSVVKWDAPSLPLLSGVPMTQLSITRLSRSGSLALMQLFEQLNEESILEDVSLDLVWFEDLLCTWLVKAGRRIKKLQLGTSGTKLTDKHIITIFEGCEALEEFALVQAEARLSRKLWSKIKVVPPHLRKFNIAISESGPHHSWTADHLESFASLKLHTVTHLSIKRILPLPQLKASKTDLEYDTPIDDIAIMKPLSSEVLEAIREMPSLISLQCDWWSWKPDDVKALSEKCTQLERLELAFDAPFAKLLSMTSTFTPMTQLRHLAVCIPPEHSPGFAPLLISPFKIPIHPLTPAASPVRRRTSLPSPVSDFASQVFVGDDSKVNEQVDLSFPPLRDIKKFSKKCSKLVDLDWYGRNARGRWLISRVSSSSSKLNGNVSVEYLAPVASMAMWNRASLEKAALDFVASGGNLTHKISRQGQEWTGPKAEEFKASLDRINEKEKEKDDASTRDKFSKPVIKRDRGSISSSTSTVSGTLLPSLNHPSGDNNSILPSPVLSDLTIASSPDKSKSSPLTQTFTPGICTESSTFTEQNNENPRARRATVSTINTSLTTPATVLTASRTRRTEIINTSSNKVHSSSEGYMQSPRGNGRGSNLSLHGHSSFSPRHGTFSRGGFSRRGVPNNHFLPGRGFVAGGASSHYGGRPGNTVPL